MAVIANQLVSSSMELNQEQIITLTENYLVESNTTFEDAGVVVADFAKQIGDANTDHPNLVLTNISVVNRGQAELYIWDCTLIFSSIRQIVAEPDPLDRIVWSGSSIAEQKPITVDLAGRAITNSAGQPFATAVEQNVKIPVITLEINISLYDWNYQNHFLDILNHYNNSPCDWSEEGGGYHNSRTLLCSDISYSVREEQGTRFINIIYQFQKGDDWEYLAVQDVGYYEISDEGSGVSDTLIQITDKYGYGLTGQSRLNGNGMKLSPDGETVELFFEIYAGANFGAIPIP